MRWPLVRSAAALALATIAIAAGVLWILRAPRPIAATAPVTSARETRSIEAQQPPPLDEPATAATVREDALREQTQPKLEAVERRALIVHVMDQDANPLPGVAVRFHGETSDGRWTGDGGAGTSRADGTWELELAQEHDMAWIVVEAAAPVGFQPDRTRVAQGSDEADLVLLHLGGLFGSVSYSDGSQPGPDAKLRVYWQLNPRTAGNATINVSNGSYSCDSGLAGSIVTAYLVDGAEQAGLGGFVTTLVEIEGGRQTQHDFVFARSGSEIR